MNKPTVLIVDDVPANIRMLEIALEPDYVISACTDGAEAIEFLTSAKTLSEPPDLILLDIVMPGMNGYEVCQKLKQNPRTRNIPVIFITARNEEEEETRGFDLGAVDYIIKPFSPAIVRARVGTHLDLKRHRDHLEELNRLLKQEITERKKSEAALRHLLKKQDMNIDLAKKLLLLVNSMPPRHVRLSADLLLFADVVSIPCYAEGGDHYFVRTLPPVRDTEHRTQGAGKTVISLKDQSGHEVGCVLRCIITDLLHNALLCAGDPEVILSAEKVLTRLNDSICNLEIFDREDFLTSLTAEIDHETLVMRYVSNGHPPFLLISGREVAILPETGGAGTNIPIAVTGGVCYSAGTYQLAEGDRLIFYTDGLTEMPLKNRKKLMTSDDLREMTEDIVSRHSDAEGGLPMPVSDIMNEILKSVADVSGETVTPRTYKRQSENTSADDVTLLCLEIENRNHFCEEVWKPENSDDIAGKIIELYERLETEWECRGYESPNTRLRTVMEEALLNAWVHGNRQDPEKSVTIRWRFGNDFHLEITDEGRGFDYQNLPDPTSDRNRTRSSGRGIFIIRYFSDTLCWKKRGSHLTVSFRKYLGRTYSNDQQTGKIVELWKVCKS